MGGLFWQEVSLAGKGRASRPMVFVFLTPYSSSSTRRRALYIVTYLLFPINVLVGVLAGVWRMVISGLYNAIHFCQLDISLLNRGVETFDPGRVWRGSLCSTSVNMGALLLPPSSWGTWPGALPSPGAARTEGGFKPPAFRNGQVGQLEQVASPDAYLVLLFYPSPRAGDALLGPLGFISGQTPFPQAADPHLSCAKGSREETSALPLLFLLGFWERSSSPALKAEQLWQGRDGALQITLPFAPGQEGGGEP